MSDWDQLKKECSWNIKSIFLNLVRNAKKSYFSKLVENNKDMLLHQFGARMNLHRRNSTKSLEEVGRIQYLVRIGFSTGLSCTLFTKKASTKAVFPKTGQTASWDLFPNHGKTTTSWLDTASSQSGDTRPFSSTSAVNTLAVPYLYNWQTCGFQL